jgi:hypothetical protein
VNLDKSTFWAGVETASPPKDIAVRVSLSPNRLIVEARDVVRMWLDEPFAFDSLLVDMTFLSICEVANDSAWLLDCAVCIEWASVSGSHC